MAALSCPFQDEMADFDILPPDTVAPYLYPWQPVQHFHRLYPGQFHGISVVSGNHEAVGGHLYPDRTQRCNQGQACPV